MKPLKLFSDSALLELTFLTKTLFKSFFFPQIFLTQNIASLVKKKFQQIFYNLRITSTDSLLHQAITPPLEISPSKVLRPGHLRPKTLVLDDIRFYFGQKAI